MKTIQLFLLFFVAFSFLATAQKKISFKYVVTYNEVEANTKAYSSRFSKDSLYIFFVEKYINDDVQIFADAKLKYTKKLKTNESYSGLTDWLVIKKKKYKLIQIVLNKEYIAMVSLRPEFNIMDISHKMDENKTEIIYINFYNQLPSFE